MSLPVDEIFPALQGEGSRMGVPSVFIRTGGCNLTCAGFGCTTKSPIDGSTIVGCDSIHAVSAKHFKHLWHYYDNSKELIRDILVKMPDTSNGNAELPDIIFTGGEPIMHHRDEVLIGCIEYFVSRGHKVWFETNGTIDIDFTKNEIYKKVSFSMSVKMSVSGEPIDKRWLPAVVNKYLKNTKDSYFKFVLSTNSIKYETSEIFDFLEQVPTFGTVYCMPAGETAEQVSLNAKAVYEFALNNGIRYSDRLHIRIYNDMRGV
jgi:organic radical activating enzyme